MGKVQGQCWGVGRGGLSWDEQGFTQQVWAGSVKHLGCPSLPAGLWLQAGSSPPAEAPQAGLGLPCGCLGYMHGRTGTSHACFPPPGSPYLPIDQGRTMLPEPGHGEHHTLQRREHTPTVT